VKDKPLFIFIPDIAYSEIFIHLKGQLAFASGVDGVFRELPSADHPDYVHTGATWSPDGKTIIFSRARVTQVLLDVMDDKNAVMAEHRVSK